MLRCCPPSNSSSNETKIQPSPRGRRKKKQQNTKITLFFDSPPLYLSVLTPQPLCPPGKSQLAVNFLSELLNLVCFLFFLLYHTSQLLQVLVHFFFFFAGSTYYS